MIICYAFELRKTLLIVIVEFCLIDEKGKSKRAYSNNFDGNKFYYVIIVTFLITIINHFLLSKKTKRIYPIRK